jgi:hypothetical protein
MIALKQLLALDRPTSKAKLYTEWAEPPKVVLEDDEARKYYDN